MSITTHPTGTEDTSSNSHATTSLPRARRSRTADRICNGAMLFLAWFGLAVLVVPTVVVLITSFDSQDLIGFPPQSLGFDRFSDLLADTEMLEAARSSLILGVCTVVLDVAIGVPAAIALVRREFTGRAVMLGFLLSPIMLPGIVIGIALLLFFSTVGLVLSMPLLVLSHVVLTLPFILRITMARMERADPSLEEAAANLGATRWQIFLRVQLPFLRPAIVAGSAFGFLISFDNLTVSLFTAPVGEPTLPIELFFRMRFDLDPVVSAVATLQILLTFVVFAVGMRMLGEKAVLRE